MRYSTLLIPVLATLSYASPSGVNLSRRQMQSDDIVGIIASQATAAVSDVPLATSIDIDIKTATRFSTKTVRPTSTSAAAPKSTMMAPLQDEATPGVASAATMPSSTLTVTEPVSATSPVPASASTGSTLITTGLLTAPSVDMPGPSNSAGFVSTSLRGALGGQSTLVIVSPTSTSTAGTRGSAGTLQSGQFETNDARDRMATGWTWTALLALAALALA